MSFTEIKAEQLNFNPFGKIGKQWFLVSAGDESTLNMMTASWGGLGVMWGKNVFTTVIRPTRKTFEMWRTAIISLSAFFRKNTVPS